MTTLHTKLKTTTFLTDGGLETDLLFNKGIDLPHFAAFPLIENPNYVDILNNYYKEYLNIALRNKTGFILESPTWRANTDWAYKLGYAKTDLIEVNKKAIMLLNNLKNQYTNVISDIFISGQLGPRGDGYTIENTMAPTEASNYHSLQISAFKESGADLVSAITMTYIDEAIGIAMEAKKNNIPVVISYTVETDGKLPSGETLKEAITKVDQITNGYPLYYMINCAHPTHFLNQIKDNVQWKSRIHGVRANASCKSHAELDESTELDIGDKKELGSLHIELKKYLTNLNIFGGCCGTDASHIEAICNYILE
jgi:S-methylmethionine-dependent homocysteine/selenocysteine methylase